MTRTTNLLANVALVLGAWCLLPTPAAADQPALATQLRRPVALQLAADGKLLYTANRVSGTLSVIDLAKRQVVAEHQIGRQLSDLESAGPGRLVATDEAAHELIVLRVNGADVSVLQRVAVPPYPVRVALAGTERAYVSSLWSRRLAEIDLGQAGDSQQQAGAARLTRTLDLDFAPRQLLLVRDNRVLIVGDAFGGQLTLVDCDKFVATASRKFPAHNIRGLAVSADGRMLVVAHQMLNDLATTVRNDVHWGLLMSNDLRWLQLEAVLTDGEKFYDGGHMHPVGIPGQGGADPGEVAVAVNGRVVVPLAGADQIVFGYESDFGMRRASVGRRPVAALVNDDGSQALVANMFDDSISVVDLKEGDEAARISLGPQPELTIAQRGELLFYDGRLAHDRWMTCHSCHTDGHTNGLLNDNFSDESFGAAKRVLTLLGVAQTGPFAWNGENKELAEQIHKSVRSTMRGRSDYETVEGPSEKQSAQLIAYLETLQPPPPLDAVRGEQDDEAVARGAALFKTSGCVRCHRAPLYTTPRTYDVGLEDKLGNRKFNPPSLRGVSQRGPYFHDNRAATLADVIGKHRHQLRRELSESEQQDLLAFLRSL